MSTCKKLPMFSRPGLHTTSLLLPFLIASPHISVFSSSSMPCARALGSFFEPGASGLMGASCLKSSPIPRSHRLPRCRGSGGIASGARGNSGLRNHHPREAAMHMVHDQERSKRG